MRDESFESPTSKTFAYLASSPSARLPSEQNSPTRKNSCKGHRATVDRKIEFSNSIPFREGRSGGFGFSSKSMFGDGKENA